ncbi:ABC transporter substrate-binding protein [Methylorubrum rhodinum]|uniref:ABC transporter substrate-binding protein n=1 Tax=Methylorubrum rhodinum TaxID=29428 RepID=UPI0028AA25DA|nr:ABC transporter substrate-binding protein [Methylorubrum rhodinum]
MPAQAQPAETVIRVVYLGKRYVEPLPISLVETVASDRGVQGARLAISENNRTGTFLGIRFELFEMIVGEDEDVVAKGRDLLAGGDRLILADLEPKDQLALADLPEAKGALLMDLRTSDDALRGKECRANVFHLLPSLAMRADAIGQYLAWKRWKRWFLLAGTTPADRAYAAGVKRAAARFGGRIVAERAYDYDPGSRRVDTGHQQIQTQMPMATRNVADHDVVFVADENGSFGDYLPYNTAEPRPVVGTAGLTAVAWHRGFEEYSAAQMQHRFELQAKRVMTERDYGGWLGARILGEVVVRARVTEPGAMRDFLLSDKFGVAAFKGEALTFRPWDQQLRQPILLAGPRMLVSISPQDGFLHPKYLTDSLGYDEPETECRLRRRS